MKRIMTMLLVLSSTIVLAACDKDSNHSVLIKVTREEEKIVNNAISALEEHWENTYSQSTFGGNGYLEIFHTRIIEIDADEDSEFSKRFEDNKKIEYLIEFQLFTDYLGSAPYYENVCMDDTIIVYKDGTMKISNNVLRLYRTQTYVYDYSDFIVNVKDLGTAFNRTINIE